MARGRPRAPGRVYYLGRLRFIPGQDPPELGEFLETLMAAESKAEILKAALIGGLGQAQEVIDAQESEDEEMTEF
jgi:hypothetical protein